MKANNNPLCVYPYDILYEYVEKEGIEHQLSNTLIALMLMDELIQEGDMDESIAQHCLMICRMMIDLNMKLPLHEKDVLLASAICHVLPEKLAKDRLDHYMLHKHPLSEEVYDTVLLLYKLETVSEAELPYWYEQIKQNKIALLITISDRGNMVEQLHDMNSWQVRRFIYETRYYYLPMCIYAKEHYHELLSPISILSEKLKNLTDVSEILMVRFEARETELDHEIIALREENATIRGILKKLQTEMKN